MKFIENDSVIRTDANEYGVITAWWRDRQKREGIEIKFITNDNACTYEKVYMINNGVIPKELKFVDKDEEKYNLLMCSIFQKEGE